MAVSVIAVIPARGGSKGVPGKNLREVGGVPLVVRAVLAAKAVTEIDRVVVSTDDPAIAQSALGVGAEVVDRPAELAGDTASSESALLHALDVVEAGGDTAEVLVFLQATSPFIDTVALAGAIERVRRGPEDSVFSAAESHVFLWRETGEGAEGVNHDAASRPRRQDREAQFAETGAFYVMRVPGFRAAGHRFFGRVGVAVVDPRGALEIDTVEELQLAGAIAGLLESSNAQSDAGGAATVSPLDRASTPIEADAVVTDFAGVPTDDRVILSDDGNEYVVADRADGTGVRMLREAGVPVLILSEEVQPVVRARAKNLHVDLIHGSDDRAAALEWWAAEHEVDLQRVAFLGRDESDLDCLALVGWPVSAADAAPAVRAASRVVLASPAGHGAVRELAERMLRARPEPRIRPTPTTDPRQHRREDSHERSDRLAARR